MENEWTKNSNIRGAGLVLLVVLALFFFVKTFKELHDWRSAPAQNVISVDGYGEVASVPDAASFSYSVNEEGTTVTEAQTKATTKSNAIIAYLKESGIEDKDIRTQNYSINPKYEYGKQGCTQYGCPPSGNPTIVGYQVDQTVSVKVRKTEKAGEILTGIGGKGASNVSGIQFTIDIERQNELQAQARAKAIADARLRAQRVAHALGVRIVRVVTFYEGGQRPMYATKNMAMDVEDAVAQVAPNIPTGENQITSNVAVTFEIR